MKEKIHNLDSDKTQGKDTEKIDLNNVVDATIQQKKTTETIILVSQYNNFKIDTANKNLLGIFDEIKSGKYKTEIDSLRVSLYEGDRKTADKIKSGLPAFTTSGTFGLSRTNANINSYSKILCLDYDHIPIEELEVFSEIINDCPYTFASFVSPSGVGLKVFVQVNSDDEQHAVAYSQVGNHYKILTDYDSDEKCRDITRLCFVSSDPGLHLNEKATTFEVQEELIALPKQQKLETIQFQSTDGLLDKCLKFTKQKEQYYNGNRNNFIHLLANNGNRFGIQESAILEFCLTNFDLDEKEIKNTITSVYKTQNTDFAMFAKYAGQQTVETNKKDLTDNNVVSEEEDVLKSTPVIPQSVYDNLPPILFESCKVFSDERERDVFLTGALTIISGCLPNVSGLYHGSKVYPCLYSFILAPAASGKGVLKFSKALADKYHEKTLAEFLEARKVYEENLAAFKMLKGKGKIEESQEIPEEPKLKVVFIPGNVSDARVIQHLDWNNGKGIICETEADTVGNTMKKEWGGYSDMLRKAFHHEKISVSRKTNSEYVEVNEPQLAIALSGTPKQIFNIIPSAEDGLFSRFLFYVFKTDAKWVDPSPKNNPVNLTKFFGEQSSQVLKMVEFFENDGMILHLTEEQWSRFNPVFSSYLNQIKAFVSEDAESVVKRIGLILYRFCMIFTSIRKFSSKKKELELFCSDTDFESALTLVEVYLNHSVIMFHNLPKQEVKGAFKSGDNNKQFFDALPCSFTRKEAVDLGITFNIAERTVDGLLKKWTGTFLNKPKNGNYKKQTKI